MIKQMLLFVLLLGSVSVIANSRNPVLSGTIKDKETGEDLIGATIEVVGLAKGTATNVYGFYSLNLKPDNYSIRFSFIGYESITKKVKIIDDVELNVELKPASEQISEITVQSEALNQNILANEIGTVKLKPQVAKMIPVLFGEQDILKTIQLMPGVSSAGEGSSGFFVRGGQADQNLVLLDDAPVFNPSHLLGFFSVFNSDAINDVKLYKGGVPANFGGRISSVLDIRMREGNSQRFSATGGIGLISSRLTLEGPLDKKGSSFLISGRRTYADLFLLFSKDEDLRKSKLYFYDLNLKVHKNLGKKDRIYLSTYMGRDIMKNQSFKFDWGNKVGTLRWTHLFSNRLFSNTSFILNDYDYNTGAELDFSFNLNAGIYGKTFKQNFSWFANNNTIKAGVEINDFKFKPGSLETITLEGDTQNFDVLQKLGLESAVYLYNEQKIGSRLSLTYGLRYSYFLRRGPSVEHAFSDAGEILTTDSIADGSWYSSYGGLEPRLNLNIVFNDQTSFKAGYNRIHQYIHLLQNATAGTPIDFWIPTSENVKPQIADQVSVGWFRNFDNNRYRLSVEGYYKWMQNQIDYKTGADLVLNDLFESQLLYGKGKAYGAEFFLEKVSGRFTGWLAYTLSRSLRQINGINYNHWYPSRQDRVHDVSVVGMYKLSNKLTLSMNWVYYTGNAVTFPSGKYVMDGQTVSYFSERNGYRMPDYHRMDVGLTWVLRKRKNYSSDLNISVYNAYARKNPYLYIFDEDPEVEGATQTTMVYLFSAVPSITWNFKF